MSDLLPVLYDTFQWTYTLRILLTFFDLFVTVAPFFLVAILLQVLLARFAGKRVLRFSAKNEFRSLILAVLIGIVSPLPTYAALPVALSFLALGVPLGSIVAFVIASPLMNPSIFYFTLFELGVKIALLRVFSTCIIALVGGLLAKRVLSTLRSPQISYTDSGVIPVRPFLMEFYRTTLFLGKYFLIALFLSATIKSLLSPEWIAQVLGGHTQKSVLIAMGLGVPFYSCGGAAIPLIATLRDLGMNDGAAVAFFIAGPATKIETFYIFKSMLGGKPLIFYLFVTLLGAYIFGLLTFWLFP